MVDYSFEAPVPDVTSNPNLPSTPPAPSGLKGIFDLANLVSTIGTDITDVLAAVNAADVKPFIATIEHALKHADIFLEPFKWLGDEQRLVTNNTSVDQAVASGRKAWEWLANWSFGSFYRGMLEVGLGLDTTSWGPDAQQAVTTADTMIGFAFIFPFIATAIGQMGKTWFSGRWSEGWSKLGEKISEEMGLSWALGMQIDDAYRIASGTAVEEAINREKHGSRIEWPLIKTLVQQHKIPMDVADELLNSAGFPKHQRELILGLNSANLGLSDIAQLWYRDEITDDKAKEYISELGFGPGETDKMFSLYMSKSENQASVLYRTVAREMFTRHLMTEDQYKQLLSEAEYPEKLISKDVTAIKAEWDMNQIMQQIATLKIEYQRGQTSAESVKQDLTEFGYDPNFIGTLIQQWTAQDLPRPRRLSQSKILSYYVSGILTSQETFNQLLASGLSSHDATLLLANPTVAPAVRQHVRTPGLIISAYIDGAIAPSDLENALLSAGVQKDDLKYYVAQAQYRMSQRKGSRHPTQFRTTADVKEWQKVGLIDYPTAVTWYEDLGWSNEDATLIAETVNKGPYQPPVPPIFPTVQSAVEYMIARGYKVFPPPDPTLLAAEGMLAQGGYSYELPTSTNPLQPISLPTEGGPVPPLNPPPVPITPIAPPVEGT